MEYYLGSYPPGSDEQVHTAKS